MTSLYGRYINERCGRGILETEDGFLTFDYVSEDTVYIVDLYVVPEKRNKHVAAGLADRVCAQAVKDGKKFLLGSVDVTAKGADSSYKVLEAYGMKVHKVAEPMIFFIKEIAQSKEQKQDEVNSHFTLKVGGE